MTLASFNLFDRSGDNAQDIIEGTAFIVESVAQLEISPGEFLQITGYIGEQDDFGSNDDLGSIDLKMPFNMLATGLVQLPVFQESNQRVSVKMSLTVTVR